MECILVHTLYIRCIINLPSIIWLSPECNVLCMRGCPAIADPSSHLYGPPTFVAPLVSLLCSLLLSVLVEQLPLTLGLLLTRRLVTDRVRRWKMNKWNPSRRHTSRALFGKIPNFQTFKLSNSRPIFKLSNFETFKLSNFQNLKSADNNLANTCSIFEGLKV